MELTIDEALNKGIEAHRAGNLQDADRFYTAILKVQPKHPDANHNLGILAMGVGKTEQALVLFKTALEANPSVSQLWISYINALIETGRISIAKKVMETAKNKGVKGKIFDQLEEKIFQIASGAEISNRSSFLKEAIALREAGHYKKAIEWLEFRISEKGKADLDTDQLAIAYALLAQICLLDQQMESAIEYLKEAETLAPDIPEVYRNRARLALKQKQPDLALTLAILAEESDPQNPESWLVLAAALGANHRNSDAISLIAKILLARPDYAEAYANRALIRLREGDQNGAIVDIEQAIELKPHMSQFWSVAAPLRYQQKDLSGAIAAQKKVIELEPSNVTAMVNLGEWLRQDKQLYKALEVLQRAVDIDPTEFSAWATLGTALQEAGRIDEAMAAYENGLSINPDSVEIANNLGFLAFEEGNFEFAIKQFSKAVQLKPDFVEAYCNMGVALTEQGNFEAAIDSFKKAIEIKPNFPSAVKGLSSAMRKKIKDYIFSMHDLRRNLDADKLVANNLGGSSYKVNLIFSPFVDPITPPLGIASLKSYLNKYSDTKIHCMDLNLEWHTMLRKMKNGDLEPLQKGAWLFRKAENEFFNVDLYRSISKTFCKFLQKIQIDVEFSLSLKNSYQLDEFFDYMEPLLLQDNPDIIGFSILFDSQILCSLLLARKIKLAHPEKIILFGGAGLMSSFDQVIHNPFVDFIITDAGEESFLKFLKSMADGKFACDIPGLAYIKEGKIIRNLPIPSNLNHDAYPDFSDFHLDQYYIKDVVIPILSSKGCYWRKCSFCQEGKINVYTEASLDKVVNEIKYHVENGHYYFQFVDEMISPSRIKILCQKIIERELKIFFYATLRPTSDFDTETFQIMHKAGCRYVIWGVESCNKRVLKLVRKGTTIKSIRNTLMLSRKAGIRNHIFMFIGFPTETPDELFETMQFIYDNRKNIHKVHCGTFTLERGTEIFLNPDKFGIEIICADENINDYKVKLKSGTTGIKANQYFEYYKNTFLDTLAIIPEFGRFRDHALHYYSKFSIETLEEDNREIPHPVKIDLS